MSPARRLAGRVRRLVRTLAYRVDLLRGAPAGEAALVESPAPAPTSASSAPLEVRLPADAVRPADADAWRRRQTLSGVQVVGVDRSGTIAWRIPEDAAAPPPFFAAPGGLPELLPVHLEACLLVLAAEEVDAVVLREEVPPPLPAGIDVDAAVELRTHAVYAASSYSWDPSTDTVSRTAGSAVVKLIDTGGVAAVPRRAQTFHRRRRGPYLTSFDPGAILRVPVRSEIELPRRPSEDGRAPLLILTSYLARGGAEHTLYEVLATLEERFETTLVTLAPHRQALGDQIGRAHV